MYRFVSGWGVDRFSFLLLLEGGLGGFGGVWGGLGGFGGVWGGLGGFGGFGGGLGRV